MKTTEEMIEVMQQYAAGASIEFACDENADRWYTARCPNWNWSEFDYRVVETVDSYAELKAAAKDSTKQIRFIGFGPADATYWQDAGYPWTFWYNPGCYEIRDKPKPPDPYAELKAAANDPTKQVRCNWAGTNSGQWCDHTADTWAWNFPVEKYEIRDKPVETRKKVKFLAWHDDSNDDGLFWLKEGSWYHSLWTRIPSEDKEVELDVVT